MCKSATITFALASIITCGIAFGQETEESGARADGAGDEAQRVEPRARVESERKVDAARADLDIELAEAEARVAALQTKQEAIESSAGDSASFENRLVLRRELQSAQDRLRQLRSQREMLSSARRRPLALRGAPHELVDLARKLRHLRAAGQNLRAAGMSDLAEAVRQHADALEREMHELAKRQPARPVQGRGGDRGEIDSLRRELQELRDEVRRLRAVESRTDRRSRTY